MKSKNWIALAAILGVGSAPAIATAAPKKPVAAKPKTIEVDPVIEVSPAPAPKNARQADEDDVPPPPPPPALPPPTPAEPKSPETLAVGAPPAEQKGDQLEVKPYLLVSGGLKVDIVDNKPPETKQDRASTFALGRIGVRARYGWVSAESEFMASGGIGLHGTSAFEGQAAMQVRQQVIRLGKDVWRVDAGRFIDEGSVDYFSAHVADTFLQDTATRDPLLFSGFNLGNGLRAQLEIVPGLRAAVTFNAGNPVSSTSSLMVGGSFPPFERFYTQPYQAVNQGPNHFPDDTFHMMVLTPSILLDTKLVDARVAVQGFHVDTNMNRSDDDAIKGYNVRGTVRVKLFDGLLIPFASAAYTRNDTMMANDLARRAQERYQATNFGGGVDLDVARRFQCAQDCADGVGAQYQQVQHQIGDGIVTTMRYINVGATYWLAPYASLGARLAIWSQEPDFSAASGERSGIVSLRFIIP